MTDLREVAKKVDALVRRFDALSVRKDVQVGQEATTTRRIPGSPTNIPNGARVKVLEVRTQKPSRKKDKFGNWEVTKYDDRIRVSYEDHDYWLNSDDLE